MRIVRILAAAAALTLGAGAAHAQAGGNTGPGNPVLVGSTDSPELRGPDDTASNINKAREEAARNARARSSSSRAVPAKPEEVTAGSEVRDSKGVVIGTVVSASMSAAVVSSAGGKVEVPLESFGKNGRGLLLPLTKAEFDAMVATANKPAN